MAARYSGSGNEDCLRFAVACGAESTQHFGAGVVDLREVERLLPEVDVEAIEPSALGSGGGLGGGSSAGRLTSRARGANVRRSSVVEPRMAQWK